MSRRGNRGRALHCGPFDAALSLRRAVRAAPGSRRRRRASGRASSWGRNRISSGSRIFVRDVERFRVRGVGHRRLGAAIVGWRVWPSMRAGQLSHGALSSSRSRLAGPLHAAYRPARGRGHRPSGRQGGGRRQVLAEPVSGSFKTQVIRRKGPWGRKDVADLRFNAKSAKAVLARGAVKSS